MHTQNQKNLPLLPDRITLPYKDVFHVIAARIHQSLALDEILQTAVDEVMQFIETDRVLIYRFNDNWHGFVAVESVALGWISILGNKVENLCFTEKCIQQYQQGFTKVMSNIEDADLIQCQIDFLKQFQVKASLVVPILQGEKLWGLLVAHECKAPRLWQQVELNLLQQLAIHIAIAIQQSSLHEKLQRELATREATQLALKQSEARFQKLSANMPGTIYQFLLCKDGSISFPFVSSGCYNLLGVKSQEIEANAEILLSMIHPDDWEKLKKAVTVSAQTLQPWKWEGRFILANSQIIWVQAASQPEKQANEDILWDGLLMDVTARKSAKIELQKAKQELEVRVLERTAQLINAIAQLENEIVERKRAETQLKQQVQREQLLNCLTSQIRNSLDLDTVLETAIQEIRKSLQVDRCQFAWYSPDKNEPYWDVVKESRLEGLPDCMGRYEVAVGEALARQLQLETLEIDNIETTKNSLLQQFVDPSERGSMLILPIKTRSGTIGTLSCSHSSGSRSWSEGEVELLSAVTDQLAIAINQAELYAQTHETATRAKEQATQLEATLQELQLTQTQLIQTEKMSSLGQLVAGIAHEINNPVNFIYGNLVHASQYTQDVLELVELYQQEHPHPAPKIQSEIENIDLPFLMEDLPKLMSSMKLGADRIREIVNSLRSFSRTEPESKAVDIHEGIDTTLMILQNRIKATSNRPAIQVIKEYGDLPLVECYSGQLNQVFMNLIVNAIDALELETWDWDTKEEEATSASRTLTPQYRIPTIRICTSAIAENRILIAIADNGQGMTAEIKEHLFNPFFTTKPIGKGTGLGLSISYQIIQEKHGGSLKCISAPGQGAEFSIEIPISH